MVTAGTPADALTEEEDEKHFVICSFMRPAVEMHLTKIGLPEQMGALQAEVTRRVLCYYLVPEDGDRRFRGLTAKTQTGSC